MAERMTEKTDITIFGGTGDLTFRKLIPALYTMFRTDKLPGGSHITIIGRRDYDDEAYRDLARPWVERFSRLPYDGEAFQAFSQLISYYRMDFTDPGAYPGLEAYYVKGHQDRQTDAQLFYLAVAPRFFGKIAEGLKSLKGLAPSKIVVEKPFGETLEEAAALSAELEACFGADSVYRIDHYLGKEMIRGISTVRFDNVLFENVWDSRCIESVTISALEDVGVEERGGYYDTSGALKDMVQNHLFQVLSIVAMERPADFSAKALHDAQLAVLGALRRPEAGDLADTLVLGQYEGYTAEPKVAADSHTETFGALRLFVDTPRWQGTPFYIRTGKRTGVRQTTVVVTFKHSAPEGQPDTLIIEIQPREGIALQFNIKRPGDFDEVVPAKMDFCQSCDLENQRNTPEAYERLLTACLRGEGAWFSQWDQIAASWQYIAGLKDLAEKEGLTVHSYPQGEPGPQAAQALPGRFGHRWGEA